jgi:hypothetical protein
MPFLGKFRLCFLHRGLRKYINRFLRLRFSVTDTFPDLDYRLSLQFFILSLLFQSLQTKYYAPKRVFRSFRRSIL